MLSNSPVAVAGADKAVVDETKVSEAELDCGEMPQAIRTSIGQGAM